MHGKTSQVEHDGKGIFAGLTTPLTCTRYHSLIVAEESLPAELMVTARTPEKRRGQAAIGDYGPAPSQLAHRGRAVSPRERFDRGWPPDDSQLSENVNAMCRSDTTRYATRETDAAGLVWRKFFGWRRSWRPVSALCAQAPATPQVPAAAQATQSEASPIAIVPLDSKNPDKAAKVTGALEVSQGKAIIAASGTVTSGAETTRGDSAASRRAAGLCLDHRETGGGHERSRGRNSGTDDGHGSRRGGGQLCHRAATPTFCSRRIFAS